eukprot:gene2576-3538_t
MVILYLFLFLIGIVALALYSFKTPSRNGFGAKTTSEEVTKGINLEGKVAIVTGANTGLGLENARVFALRGAHVILACRNQKKMNEAAEGIKKEIKNAKITCMELDLGDLESVNSFVKKFKKMNLPLHILVANAGITGGATRELTKDGFESNMGINHFGTFSHTVQMVPFLVKTAKETGEECRIVVLTSYAYCSLGTGKIDFENLNFEKPGSYDVWAAYAQSKIGNIVMANELHKRLKGTNVTCNSVHPGTIKTQSSKDVSDTFFYRFITFVSYPFMKDCAQGASTQVYAATHPELQGKGQLLLCDCNEWPLNAYTKREDVWKKLFDVSEEMTGVKFSVE